jgi:transposase-like protein
MSARGAYRRHSLQFKIQICSDVRSGKIGRREAVKAFNLSPNLMQLWLTQFDRGELDDEEAAASTVVEYEAHIAALERKVGQLTMELDLLKKTPRLPLSNRRARLLLRRHTGMVGLQATRAWGEIE